MDPGKKIYKFKTMSVIVYFRVCLGKKFALMQSKSAIIEIVSKFEISVNDKTQRPLILDPKQVMNYKIGGLWLNFHPLND